jgi:biotin carboxyl carrier protein
MELIVRQKGRERTVLIERTTAGYEVSIDGSSFHVDSAAAGRTVRSLVINGRQVEVSVRRETRTLFDVVGSGGAEQVEVLEPLALLAEKQHGGEAGLAASRINAYMPGRVVQLLVEEGEAVQEGQGVLVLEAMKMENEIQAERDGVIERFFVAPGQAVEGGDPLYELGVDG